MQAAAQCVTRGGLGQRLPRFPRLIPPASEFPRTTPRLARTVPAHGLPPSGSPVPDRP
ncbi:hypothetical protein TPA0910_19930 [Streptomyces hygroscopicus subsp. sporocinereus]|uniref:Uncharacterized protein n=1 Tax=Streptomyces hygroscopicus TaxID=1912 RepID=A0ABQ3TW60_STRHY|nr:hypothetical protein TPA0910_19930 [Streptomyces hygroscopicus]